MRVTSFTHRGSYDINEDYMDKTRKNGIYCFVVSDGGGIGNGDIASQTVVNAILSAFEENPEISESAMRKYFDKAYEMLQKKGHSDILYNNMYASAVVLITDGERIIWGSIGDCRIYRFAGKMLEEVSEDDTSAFKKYLSGETEYSSIRCENPEIPLKTLNPSEHFDISVSKVSKMKYNYKFLLCSKGFWIPVTEKEMEDTLKSSKTSKEWLSKMLSNLEKKSENVCDNISVYAIFTE